MQFYFQSSQEFNFSYPKGLIPILYTYEDHTYVSQHFANLQRRLYTIIF